MQIEKRDEFLVFEFLLREAEDFQYKSRVPFNVAGEYLSMLKEELAKINGKANYIFIHSITNSGAISRSLKITPVEWGYCTEIHCNLPPAPPPKGKIYVYIKEMIKSS